MSTWVDPFEGFEYQTDTVTVEASHQAEKLADCGLDAAVFGDQVDPSFFIGIAIHAGIASGISAEGNINMLQSLVQHRPVLLGEPLTVKGRITRVQPVPRGRTIETDCWFEGEDGNRAITALRRSLKPDPDKRDQKGAGERPPPVIENVTGLAGFGEYSLTPDRVKGYSMEGNSIHYEMEAAQKAGFRAPIIGGGMGVHFLMATIWQHLSPDQFDMDIYFRRPVFWDDSFRVMADIEGGIWRAICLAKDEKVATEARLNQIV
ncbi:MAG: hypothetical protein HUJ31_19890 [Pseudomonadales bacterium]|nr:hypothetical protein [Pseudomonadales bacterium]